MRINRKVIESAAVMVFALVIAVAANVTGNGSTKAEQYTSKALSEEADNQKATKEKNMIDMVAAADMTMEEAVLIAGGTSEEEVVSPWAARLMPNVEEYLNVRAEASAEAEVVGKLYKGAAADILERGEEWTKISSGSVTGYVKNEYCVFDEQAEALANQLGTVYATALASGLRVRAEASTAEGVSIVDVLEQGEKLAVDKAATAPEDWVAVTCKNGTAYVSAQYVSVELELGKAISIAEEQAAIKKAEEAKKAAEAKKQAQVLQKEAIVASYDEVTLLAALIQCEAGGESYEGQLAVGAVVMNRIRRGYATTISGVIFQKGQFTPVSSGALQTRLAKGVKSSCLQAAQEAINGLDNVNGAIYFCRVTSGKSGIVIGNHVFYK